MGTSASLTSEQAAVAGGIMGASMMMIMAVALVLIILNIIARWKIFTKAGEKGWKSIIPIYSDYVEWRIGWKKTGFFWLAIILIIAGYVMGYMDGTFVTDASGQLVSSGNFGTLGIIGLVMMFTAGIIDLVAAYKLFASFGHGAGWFIGYLFIPHIMMLVLGFGSSQYYGARN